MKVPLLDLGAHHKPLREEILEAVRRVVDSNGFVLGPEVKRLEEEVAAYCGTSHAIGVSSGSDALLIALMALGIGPGDEVITTPFSFFATAGAISRLGARPVFVDIDPVTFNLHPDLVAGAVTEKTKALLPVHLYGQCADMDPLLEVAHRSGLKVIEDAAQAIGAEYQDGRRAGSMGIAGCISFFPTKNLGALGDAGMVVTTDTDLARRIEILRVHGSEPKYHHQFLGGNFRIDALQAAVLSVKLKHLDGWTAGRQKNARRYDELLDGAGVELPHAAFRDSGKAHFHIYNQYVIRAPRRDELRSFLADREIASEIYYPIPFHLQDCFAYLGYKPGAFPETERACREVLALPVYPELTAEQQEWVARAIREFYA